MKLDKAKSYLEQVLNRDRCIPFHRYCGGVGRTAQAKNENSTTGQGRWPVKSVEFIRDLLRNAESNAEVRLQPLRALPKPRADRAAAACRPRRLRHVARLTPLPSLR
jgi:hypothetical protein